MVRLVAVGVVVALTACAVRGPSPSPSPVASDTSTPSDQAQFTVAPRDLNIAYKLAGVSVHGSYVGLPSAANAALRLTVASGATVTAGQPLGELQPDPTILAELKKSAPTSTVAASQLAGLQARKRLVKAPVNGVLSSQGGASKIRNDGLDAVVSLSPLQFLRYQTLEFSGTVVLETAFGAQTANCVALWLEKAPETTGGEDAGPAPAGALHCRLPASVESAPGLPLTVTLTSQSLKNVLAVPAIYIGLDKTGKNYVVSKVGSDGRAVQQVVSVGATDGVARVVTAGLKSGDVLELPAGS